MSVIPERDKEIFELAGYGSPIGLGERPGLLMIDVVYSLTDKEPLPIEKSIQNYRTSCGGAAWAAVAMMAKLLEVCRTNKIPVIYTRNRDRSSKTDFGLRSEKNDRWAEEFERPDTNSIVAEVAPTDEDKVIQKDKPSAFFGTPLISHIVGLSLDSIILVGGTTSGCVRATALDAYSYNLRTAVVSDAVFDRVTASHELALFDLNAKYADVLDTSEILDHLSKISTGTPHR